MVDKDSPAGAAGGPYKPAMPLMMVAEGQEATLAEIRGGKQLTHRLAEMGLTPGARFRVISQGRHGPCIVCVKDTRLVLGRGMVHRVYVLPE